LFLSDFWHCIFINAESVPQVPAPAAIRPQTARASGQEIVMTTPSKPIPGPSRVSQGFVSDLSIIYPGIYLIMHPDSIACDDDTFAEAFVAPAVSRFRDSFKNTANGWSP